MVEGNPNAAWQFSLRTLFFAVTTSAIGCGLAASDLPLDLKYFGLCVPIFWTGMAATFFGSAGIDASSQVGQIVGEFTMALGFVLSFGTILIGSFAAVLQIAVLVVRLLDYLFG